MTDLVGPDGRALSDDLVTPAEYLQNVRSRAGFSKPFQEFLRRNPLDLPDGDPTTFSKSQRQLYAMRELLAKSAMDGMHLWGLLSAACELAGGEMTFSQTTLRKFMTPKEWPVVTPDADGNITVKLGAFKDVVPDAQLALPLEVETRA